MTLQNKIDYSITLLQKYETLALKLSDKGFHLAFSGGKDSQVIYKLAQMAGVKFQAYFYKTSVDSNILLKFIKTNYSDVIWLYPKKTMFQLIIEKKTLPTRKARFCCDYLKERNGLNELVVLGIRKAESNKRKARKEFTEDCKLGGTQMLLSPILDWTDKEVFKFLNDQKISLCELYNTQKRIGCIGCPMNSKNWKELNLFPKHKRAYINTAQKVIDLFPDSALAKHFGTGQNAYDWWVSGMGIKKWKSYKECEINFN